MKRIIILTTIACLIMGACGYGIGYIIYEPKIESYEIQVSHLTSTVSNQEAQISEQEEKVAKLSLEKRQLQNDLGTAQSRIQAYEEKVITLNTSVAQLISQLTPSPDHAITWAYISENKHEFISIAWRGNQWGYIQAVKEIGWDYQWRHTYIPDQTDCDDMAVDLWNILLTGGIKSVIVVGNLDKQGEIFQESNHAWLFTFGPEGKYLILEPTTGEVIYSVFADGSSDPKATPYLTGYMYKKPSDLWADVKKGR